MTADAVVRGAVLVAAAAGAAAVVNATTVVAARVAADFPDFVIETDAGAVRLRAPGLLARAFGSRHRAADPRLTGLVALLTTGGG